jgi:hypothetical protein
MEINEDVLCNIWKMLYKLTKNCSIDVETVRLDGRRGKWFSARCDGNNIIIQNSTTNNPATELSQPRYISKEEFIRIGLSYERWRARTMPRSSIRNLSENTSYIFAIIEKFKRNFGDEIRV